MKRKRNNIGLQKNNSEGDLQMLLKSSINNKTSLSTLICLVNADLKHYPRNPNLSCNCAGTGFHNGNSCVEGTNLFDRLLELVHCGKPTHALDIVYFVIRKLLQDIQVQNSLRIHDSYNCKRRRGIKFYVEKEAFDELKAKLSSSFFRMLSISSPQRDECREDRIYKVVHLFLSFMPDIRFQVSKSGNTPLHLALLHNGHSERLIKLLFEHPKNQNISSVLTKTNNSGKLPIHIAICAGSPTSILKIIINATIKSFSAHGNRYINIAQVEDGNGMHPIEMAWIRRIDPDFRLYKGSIQSSQKANKMYHTLLSDAVEQVEKVYSKSINSNPIWELKTKLLPDSIENGHHSIAYKILGSFWSNTLLLLRGAHYGTASDPLPNGKQWRLVHAAAASWSCPLGVLRIALLLHPEQLYEKDENGMLPLHLAINSDIDTIPQSRLFLHYEKIEFLIQSGPRAAMIENKNNELPLHLILRRRRISKSDIHTREQSFWMKLLSKVVSVYPDAVDIIDPVSRLFPFMQAAILISNVEHEQHKQSLSYDPLNAIFFLLRRSPARILKSIR